MHQEKSRQREPGVNGSRGIGIDGPLSVMLNLARVGMGRRDSNEGMSFLKIWCKPMALEILLKYLLLAMCHFHTWPICD